MRHLKYQVLAEKIITSKGLIKKIIKNKKRVGTLVALKTEDSFSIGYSLCRKDDTFDKFLSLSIAYERALKDASYSFPFSIQTNVSEFIERAEKYFQTTYRNNSEKFLENYYNRIHNNERNLQNYLYMEKTFYETVS